MFVDTAPESKCCLCSVVCKLLVDSIAVDFKSAFECRKPFKWSGFQRINERFYIPVTGTYF